MPHHEKTPHTISRRQALVLLGGAMTAVSPIRAEAQKGLLLRSEAPLIDLEKSAEDNRLWSRPAKPQPRPEGGTALSGSVSDLANRLLTMRNLNTDERIAVRPVGLAGFEPQALARLSHFMRDWRDNESLSVSPAVIAGLLRIQMQAQRDGFSGDVQLNSGYRTRRTNALLRRRGLNAARNSFHLQARAADFVLPGVPVAETIEMAKALDIGGVGGYPNFVHIDDGPTRYWGRA